MVRVGYVRGRIGSGVEIYNGLGVGVGEVKTIRRLVNSNEKLMKIFTLM